MNLDFCQATKFFLFVVLVVLSFSVQQRTHFVTLSLVWNPETSDDISYKYAINILESISVLAASLGSFYAHRPKQARWLVHIIYLLRVVRNVIFVFLIQIHEVSPIIFRVSVRTCHTVIIETLKLVFKKFFFLILHNMFVSYHHQTTMER